MLRVDVATMAKPNTLKKTGDKLVVCLFFWGGGGYFVLFCLFVEKLL